MSIPSTSAAVVPFAQGQDVSKLRAAVDRSSQEIKDYQKDYEDQRTIVDALSAAQQAEPDNKSILNILAVREKRLDAARVREAATLSLLSNCLIADNSAAQVQATTAAALATPTVATTTTPSTTTTAEKKIVKRKLPEPRDG
jgi:hypothetical protein